MRGIIVFFLATAALAQTSDIHVSAQSLSPSTLKALFGRSLPKAYSGVQVDVCSNDNRSLAVPLGVIRQQFQKQFPQSTVTILSNDIASQVIASAQGSTKTAIAGRAVLFAVGAAAVATGFAGVGVAVKGALTGFSIDGPVLWGLFSSVTVPAALVGYQGQALPETIQLAPAACMAKPAIQLVEGSVRSVEFDVTLPRSTTPTNGALTVTPQSDGTLVISGPPAVQSTAKGQTQ